MVFYSLPTPDRGGRDVVCPHLIFQIFGALDSEWLPRTQNFRNFGGYKLTGAKRREWMGCWGLLGLLLKVSIWIIPSFPKHQYPLVNVYIAMERSTMLLMGKSTISMAIFNSFLYVHQRVSIFLRIFPETHPLSPTACLKRTGADPTMLPGAGGLSRGWSTPNPLNKLSGGDGSNPTKYKKSIYPLVI